MIDSQTLATLIDFLNDELTNDEADQLVKQFREEPELIDCLLEIATEEAIILDWAHTYRQTKPNQAISEKSTPAGFLFPGQAVRWGLHSLFVAASLLIAASVLLLPNNPPNDLVASADNGSLLIESELGASSTLSPSLVQVAEVVNVSDDSSWFLENRLSQSPSGIRPGDTLRVIRGVVRAEFTHGTAVTLQGPSVLEVHDGMRTRIHNGNIRVDVAEGAEGFAVITPHARVIDLGTNFGINVDADGETDVVVFEGAVDIEQAYIDGEVAVEKRRLNTGEALHLDEMGTASRIVMIQPNRFPEEKDGPHASKTIREAVITEVNDNIRRDDSYKFYQIVRAGMFEDAKAYVDRIGHEWNGLDASGMPKYLIGGDYVKMFNDDKNRGRIDKLEVTMRLAVPSAVYILFDDRVSIPNWLEKDFVDTGDDIGLDEGKYWNDFQDDWVIKPQGIGPGVHVDTVFSVWKRVVTKPQKIRFGPVPTKNNYINNYGIVATPLEQL